MLNKQSEKKTIMEKVTEYFSKLKNTKNVYLSINIIMVLMCRDYLSNKIFCHLKLYYMFYFKNENYAFYSLLRTSKSVKNKWIN